MHSLIYKLYIKLHKVYLRKSFKFNSMTKATRIKTSNLR